MRRALQILSFLAVAFMSSWAGAAPNPPASFADLAERLLPAVVNISTTQEIQEAQLRMDIPQFPPGSPFEDFFRDFFERGFPGIPGGPGREGMMPQERKITSLGSGFIISPQGHVVTNNHVIAQADEIRVILADDTELPAKIIGHDPKTDLALLKVEHARPLPFLKWGESGKARVGDWVIAIGNPFGLGGTVTSGIVSARARNINAGPYDDFLQTDASINRGNSGGPMFNMAGEVIGVNTAIFSPTGGSVGIGFAVPSDLARPVVDQLMKYGRTKRGWLGVRIQEITGEIAESLSLKNSQGALVASVTEGGPAEKAGLQAGDVIVKFNDREIREMRQLPRVVAETEVGATVGIEVMREGKLKKFRVELGELEKAEEAGLFDEESQPSTDDMPKSEDMVLGMRLLDLDAETRRRFGIPPGQRGVLVAGVQSNSEAQQKAIRTGDFIISADQRPVNSLKDLRAILADVKSRKKGAVLLRIVSRTGISRFVVLPLEEKIREPKQ